MPDNHRITVTYTLHGEPGHAEITGPHMQVLKAAAGGIAPTMARDFGENFRESATLLGSVRSGVVVTDSEGELHEFPCIESARATFADGNFRDARLIGASVADRLRSLLAGA